MKIKKSVGLLLNREGKLIMDNAEEVEVFNAYFTSTFIEKGQLTDDKES